MKKKIIIQKFGGTSLQDDKTRLKSARFVKQKFDSGFIPVVVVSAMGREGAPYATDTLLKLAKEIEPEINPREKDLLMSCGEIISAVVFVQTLQKLGLKAIALTGAQAGIITDGNFGSARIRKVMTDNLLQIILQETIPVVTGFQGMNENGEITTFGRGGSDTTASVLAVALQAEEIEIYTDVEGILSADPKNIKKTSTIKIASYEEAVELAEKGAKVIHPRAVEIAASENIPIKILSTFTGINGTIIKNIKSDRPITGITSKENIIFFRIEPTIIDSRTAGLNIFQLLAENSISADFIDIRPESISFIIDEENRQNALQILEKNNFLYMIKEGLVKVSAVGSGMTGVPGIMAKIVSALTSQEIEILECTDSRTTISCLIKSEEKIKAIKALHDIFEL
ncbi:MAG: aspartate kinase [Candidatus Cloacimonadales bacterium]|nr:aspartate kinase [Candidatus Cloacimonadales bacterium]